MRGEVRKTDAWVPSPFCGQQLRPGQCRLSRIRGETIRRGRNVSMTVVISGPSPGIPPRDGSRVGSVPPAAPQRLEERRGVRVAICPRLSEADDRLKISLL